MDEPDDTTRARVFWTGGSQALRLPKAMRLPGNEVILKRKGKTLIVEPVEDSEADWDAMWDRLVPLKEPVQRWPTRRAERRRAV